MDCFPKKPGVDGGAVGNEPTPVHFIFVAGDALCKRCAPSFPFVKDDLLFDEHPQPNDGWLVLCNANRVAVLTRVPRSRRIFIIGESSVSHYPVAYLNQFGILVSPFRIAGYEGQWFQSHPALPWFFGASFHKGKAQPTLSFQELAHLPVPEKRQAVSVVVSSKTLHPGHRKRIRFLELLKDRLGDRLVIFGRGFHEIGDKAEAILPFAYHLALENTIEPFYWTEKLPDALLGYALPIYSGCPNVEQWLPARSFEPVDLDHPDDAEARISKLLEVGAWRKRLPLIIEARRQVMEKETVFSVVARVIGAYPDDSPRLAASDRLIPPARSLGERIGREAVRIYHQITFRTRLGAMSNSIRLD